MCATMHIFILMITAPCIVEMLIWHIPSEKQHFLEEKSLLMMRLTEFNCHQIFAASISRSRSISRDQLVAVLVAVSRRLLDDGTISRDGN